MLRWTLVIPVKRLAVAKSRLSDPARNRALALAFAVDAVTAAAAAQRVRQVVVVTGDHDVAAAVSGPGVLVRPDVRAGGLNAALRSGATYAVTRWGPHPVAALPSDLPALRTEQLDAALAAAEAHDRAFVPDADDAGTTLLTARAGDLDPRYGPGSARAHQAAGSTRLAGDWPGLRRDVDVLDDLRVARSLGVGIRTAELSACLGAPPGAARAG